MLAKLKNYLRPWMPYESLRIWGRLKNRNSTTGTEDVRKIFSDIYKSNRWGGSRGEFFSGSGSDAAATENFIRTVNEFVAGNDVHSVADLGCGDFRVGSQIAKLGINYTGVDVVQDLILHNQKKFGREGVQFACLNIIEDELPKADLCIVRQVLQHLSNEQIAKILPKLSGYRFAIVAEHHPGTSKFSGYNFDKPAGSDVRIYSGSGVYLDQPPFSLPNLRILCESAPSKWLLSNDEVITTYLFTSNRAVG